MNKKQENNQSELCKQLWIELEPKIRRVCTYKMTSCPFEIDEVISQTYLTLCVKLSENKIKNPKSWMYATAINLIKMTYEEQNKHKQRFISLDTGIPESHQLVYSTDFLEKQLTNDELDILKAQVEAELEFEERELIRYINAHKKYREIAEITNSTEAAVKQRAYRLRGKVREIAKEKIKNFK